MDFFKIIDNSETIICRSGYSSIMDLSTLQKQVILIPTPGQTEQEYLSKYHQKKSNVTTAKQSAINLDKIKQPIPIKQTANDSQLMTKVFERCGL
jgi:UDP-N-acetylglucosamine:LPS N-acetylglucosamine transferase